MSKTVLVIDDEEGYRDMLKMDLSGEGFQVLTAGTGVEALGIAQKEKLDLVITDMRMPDMDGLESIYEIKKLHPSVPIILITGFAMEHLVNKALELFSATCLSKPFTFDQLMACVHKAVDGTQKA